MNPDRLLMLLAAEAARGGQTAPQLDSEQARSAAERLIAAVGLTRPEPARQLESAPAPARIDSPTTVLPTYRPGRHEIRRAP